MKPLYEFLKNETSFRSQQAFQYRTLYFPLCGTSDKGIKSVITPLLSGDMKIDKYHYITKPFSREDLRQVVRDFYAYIPNQGVVSLSQVPASPDCYVELGLLWHRVVREFKTVDLRMEALNFVPITEMSVEVMRIKITNTNREQPVTIVPTFAIPLFARALANKHDHEHVTSLLHRIEQFPNGVIVTPTMKFNEEGHQTNDEIYFVLGVTSLSANPLGSFPTVDAFLGDQGTPARPQAVYENHSPQLLSGSELNGKEAYGALRFNDLELEPEQSQEFILMMGLGENPEQIKTIYEGLNTVSKVDQAFFAHQKWWDEKARTLTFEANDRFFQSWMHWVTIQPVLRRIYGCSFLPDHDYGKGGKGWRDLWQDLLSLILIEPQNVRAHLINNFAGVRIDGSNATIIGTQPGEFIADRNAITRVWMDHGVWPFMTVLLYIHQTGDLKILFEENTYFKDMQLSRSREKDTTWDDQQGQFLLTAKGDAYKGTLLEHILVQHLVQFYNVGEHNITRLESADWNDGLDMAFPRGESVAFMSVYAGNLSDLADLLEVLIQKKQIKCLKVFKELQLLMEGGSGIPSDYDSIDEKRRQLFDIYLPVAQPAISGEKVDIEIERLIKDLRKKAQWMKDFIRDREWLLIEHEDQHYAWFNGYYDNQGQPVEGYKGDNLRMTLTGQVFPIMAGVATDDQARMIIKSVSRFLVDKKLEGIRLNTDFGIPHYLDLGRAFGFAFGTKENGAFFSHMSVMYAYALYKRGFAQEGNWVLNSIYKMARQSNLSKIYPGIPEYFDSQGRGMYHYLTGSASWYILTVLTQKFGIRGAYGDLMVDPKLTQAEFDSQGLAQVTASFAEKPLKVTYHNINNKDYGEYAITKVNLNGENLVVPPVGTACIIKRSILETCPSITIQIELS